MDEAAGCSEGATGRMAVGTTGMIGVLTACATVKGTTERVFDTGLAPFVAMPLLLASLEVGARSSEGCRVERAGAISAVRVGAAVEKERPNEWSER